MLSLAFRRGAFISQKVLILAGSSSHRCWTSSLGSRSHHVSASSFVYNHKATRQPFLSPPKQSSHSPIFAASIHSSVARLKKRPQTEPAPRELDLLRYDMKDLSKSPKPALYLGFSGLLPFMCPTLYMAITESFVPELAYAQVAYGASILSFLGGARWGFALPPSSPAKPDWINLSNSVVPSLLAWISMLMCENIVPAATMVIMGLGIALHYDLSLLPTYPSWFKALRSILTGVAFLSLVGMLVANGVYPKKKLFTEE